MGMMAWALRRATVAKAVNGIFTSVRGWFADERILSSAIAALLVAFVIAYVLDLAIDATWIPEVFFGVFVAGFVLIYRTGKAPSLPSGEMLTGLGWMLILFVFTLAVLRLYTRVQDAIG